MATATASAPAIAATTKPCSPLTPLSPLQSLPPPNPSHHCHRSHHCDRCHHTSSKPQHQVQANPPPPKPHPPPPLHASRIAPLQPRRSVRPWQPGLDKLSCNASHAAPPRKEPDGQACRCWRRRRQRSKAARDAGLEAGGQQVRVELCRIVASAHAHSSVRPPRLGSEIWGSIFQGFRFF